MCRVFSSDIRQFMSINCKTAQCENKGINSNEQRELQENEKESCISWLIWPHGGSRTRSKRTFGIQCHWLLALCWSPATLEGHTWLFRSDMLNCVHHLAASFIVRGWESDVQVVDLTLCCWKMRSKTHPTDIIEQVATCFPSHHLCLCQVFNGLILWCHRIWGVKKKKSVTLLRRHV